MPIITTNKIMEEIGMKTRNHGLDEREMELVKLLMADCKSTGDIQAKLKKLFGKRVRKLLCKHMLRPKKPRCYGHFHSLP